MFLAELFFLILFSFLFFFNILSFIKPKTKNYILSFIKPKIKNYIIIYINLYVFYVYLLLLLIY
eukprot:NODE_138_length_1602_cov_618.506117_g76_i0.p1 GENE.NODE_138_length_1602_cov_618.506117_g76_i0~~NODE_138_length_1602_cov_618.506117_g76_i0.p1  ORF type:complete len:64 (-),score=0.32 NODE_138_length_1602_cov_618.506117_g76_i0:736-927(-)